MPAPGEWLDIYQTNPAAKRLAQTSEVLKQLEDLKMQEAAKQAGPVPWIKSKTADIIFACAIVAYGIVTGIDIEITVRIFPDPVQNGYDQAMMVIQGIFTVVFLFELILRVRAEGIRYCLPIMIRVRCKGCCPLHIRRGNPAGFFDAAIIILGTLELGVSLVGIEGGVMAAAAPMRMLRLVRLVRILRGLLVFQELRLLCEGMVSSLSAVFWSFMLLTMLMYLGALFCSILLGKNEELGKYFGTVGQALFTHFMIITLESWPDISDEVMAASSPLWGLYFVVFICVSSLALMNLVTGVICDNLLSIARTEEGEAEQEVNRLNAFREDRAKFREQLQEVFNVCDLDHSSDLSLREFGAMLERADFKTLLRNMEVSTDIEPAAMFNLLDAQEVGTLNFEQLAESLLRLRGSRRKLHSLLLQHDLLQRSRREVKSLELFEEDLCQRARAELGAVEEAVSAELEELLRAVNGHSSCCSAFDGEGASLEEFAPLEEPTQLDHLVPLQEPAPLLPEPAPLQEPCAGGDVLEAADSKAGPASPLLEGLQASPETAEPPWEVEATARLEALIAELDELRAGAKELLLPEGPGQAVPGSADGKAPDLQPAPHCPHEEGAERQPVEEVAAAGCPQEVSAAHAAAVERLGLSDAFAHAGAATAAFVSSEVDAEGAGAGVQFLSPVLTPSEAQSWLAARGVGWNRKRCSPHTASRDSFSVLVVEGNFALYCLCDGQALSSSHLSHSISEGIVRYLLESQTRCKDPDVALWEAICQGCDLLKHRDVAGASMTCAVAYHDMRQDTLSLAQVGNSCAVLGRPSRGSDAAHVQVLGNAKAGHQCDVVLDRVGMAAIADVHHVRLSEERRGGKLVLLFCTRGVWSAFSTVDALDFAVACLQGPEGAASATEALTEEGLRRGSGAEQERPAGAACLLALL